jgi:hypothetical protein
LGEARRLAPAGPGGTTGDYLKTIDEADQLGAVHGHTRPCTYEQLSFLEYFAACYLGAERDRLKLRATRCD